MNDLNIAATSMTPAIVATWDAGRLRFEGDSYPENSFDFFRPVVGWLNAYLREETRPLLMEVRLAYLNTSSVRVMMDLLDLLEEAYGNGRGVSLTWFYEAGNERAAELAEEFKEDCTFPYVVTPVVN
ncbi:MAG: DUF1987 domain-containing protein [Betaproteobacteria bacterium]|nr:DUF1987 domain-containing protein [Betaproteobacteria bacterium]